jgi:dienelactone hydrolase
MDIQSRDITWTATSNGETTSFVGKLWWDENLIGPRAGVMVAPAFRGRTNFEEARAQELAALGYAALEVDYYGGGKHTFEPEQANAWKDELDADRPMFEDRMKAALKAFQAEQIVAADRIAAIGFCLGGRGVLDLARSGSDIKGVVALHGLLDRAPTAPDVDITSKVLVLHGWDDPLVPPSDVVTFTAEMTQRRAPWHLHGYGHTGHSFTNPIAKPGIKAGFEYSEYAAKCSWRSVVDFMADTLH